MCLPFTDINTHPAMSISPSRGLWLSPPLQSALVEGLAVELQCFKVALFPCEKDVPNL